MVKIDDCVIVWYSEHEYSRDNQKTYISGLPTGYEICDPGTVHQRSFPLAKIILRGGGTGTFLFCSNTQTKDLSDPVQRIILLSGNPALELRRELPKIIYEFSIYVIYCNADIT